MSRSRMVMLPRLVSRMWEQMDRPHRLLDQHFGVAPMQPDRLLRSIDHLFDRMYDSQAPATYYRPWAELLEENNRGESLIQPSKDKFQVALDVQQFKPEEINVKIIDNYVVIEGKHEEKDDEHGKISRHFVRKYMIPDIYDAEKATGTLLSDGVLSVSAPIKPEAIENIKEKKLNIEYIKSKDQQDQENKDAHQQQIEDQRIDQKQ